MSFLRSSANYPAAFLAEIFGKVLTTDNTDKKINLLSGALKHAPNHPLVLMQLGIAYYEKDEFFAASEYLIKAVLIDGTHQLTTRVYLGNIFHKLIQPVEHVKMFYDTAMANDAAPVLLNELLSLMITCWDVATLEMEQVKTAVVADKKNIGRIYEFYVRGVDQLRLNVDEVSNDEVPTAPSTPLTPGI